MLKEKKMFLTISKKSLLMFSSNHIYKNSNFIKFSLFTLLAETTDKKDVSFVTILCVENLKKEDSPYMKKETSFILIYDVIFRNKFKFIGITSRYIVFATFYSRSVNPSAAFQT